MDGHDHGLHFVRTVPLFAGLPETTKHHVASAVVTRQYQRDERIYGPGDRTGLFIVHEGLVKVHRLAASGTEQLLRLMSPGDFLGETALLADTTTDHFAVALRPSELCMLDRERFKRLLGQHPGVAVHMLQTVSGRLGLAEHMVSDLTGRSVAQRLAQQLLLLADEAGRADFTLPTTKKELASYLGTTPETLSRRLATLQEAGVIRLGSGQSMELLDPASLRTVSSGG
ncbi:Crp/Fnr family transcriptional regulator [Nocardioides jensenii]|uniref:Crp/Fnr family transcriptional regulator n=1 Tax=Nocardioides jensenii TaxID=1843 RepID=UPI000836B4BF|nr:Crp/Fnr family transcriptional regulator [Nocardioides jensenii]